NSISRCGCRQSSFFSTNANLALQLVWSTSDPARGIIRASGGLTAIYEEIFQLEQQGEGFHTPLYR
ncbi:MAG: hypothetical protein WCL49_12645, partial [bacterium]